MADAARSLFDSLADFSRVQELIDNGEAEGPQLECKSPGAPQLSRELKAKLGEAVSGFANTGGGVIVWGVSTTKHAHSGLDVLTQIEPIGNCKSFAQQVDRSIPTIAYPTMQVPTSKTLHYVEGESRGIVITYIPPTSGDPVQSLIDRKFHFRNGDEFAEMPYEILKRMFTGVAAPDLAPVFNADLVTVNSAGVWKIPILLENRSSAVGEDARVLLTFLNAEACARITPRVFRDVSAVNPGQRVFIAGVSHPIYRGLNFVAGEFRVSMRKGKLPRRVLNLRVKIFSNKMRAHSWDMAIQLAKKGFSVRSVRDEYLY